MAEVWLARRSVVPGGLKPCALKIIHGRVASQARHRRMFLQEARLALKLRHANVVSVFDAGEIDGRLFMALEWIDGLDLRRFTERVRAGGELLSIPIVCHIMAQLLQGLRHAHGLTVGGRRLGVVHRDIAPHNVLLSAAGEIKLADFGIAKIAGDLSSGEHVKGRARYMAPEQLSGRATQASDLFALGGVLHELLDGRRFRELLGQRHGGNWHEVVARAPIPTLTRPDVPAPLEALRRGLLQADPSRRIATAASALEVLMRCPPWPVATDALQTLYRRHVCTVRRTGLTWSEPISLGSATPAARPHHRCGDALRSVTATLAQRHSTPSSPHGHHDSALVTRRRSLPSRPPAPPRRLRAIRWVGRGLWALAALLGMTAAGLALGSTPRSTRHRLPSCIDEPGASVAQPAKIRLRGNGKPHAQVRIDMQVLDVAAGIQCQLSPGFHDLAWRSSSQDTWQPVGSHTLVSAKEHLMVVGEDGLAISAYDP